MSYSSVEPIFEHICKCQGGGECSGVSFRIIGDDGCYMVLIPDIKPGAREWDGKTWKPTPWIFPEAHDVLKKLSRPRGAIYDITRDGPMPEGANVDEFVAERIATRLEEEKQGRPS